MEDVIQISCSHSLQGIFYLIYFISFSIYVSSNTYVMQVYIYQDDVVHTFVLYFSFSFFFFLLFFVQIRYFIISHISASLNRQARHCNIFFVGNVISNTIFLSIIFNKKWIIQVLLCRIIDNLSLVHGFLRPQTWYSKNLTQ